MCAKGSAWLSRNGDADAGWFFSLLQPSLKYAQLAGPVATAHVQLCACWQRDGALQSCASAQQRVLICSIIYRHP